MHPAGVFMRGRKSGRGGVWGDDECCFRQVCEFEGIPKIDTVLFIPVPRFLQLY